MRIGAMVQRHDRAAAERCAFEATANFVNT
jgi:hypothetical protein